MSLSPFVGMPKLIIEMLLFCVVSSICYSTAHPRGESDSVVNVE